MTLDDIPTDAYVTGVILATGAAAIAVVWVTVGAVAGAVILAGRVYEKRTRDNAGRRL